MRFSTVTKSILTNGTRNSNAIMVSLNMIVELTFRSKTLIAQITLNRVDLEVIIHMSTILFVDGGAFIEVSDLKKKTLI